MPTAIHVSAGIRKRITGSGMVLTVTYPPARVPATGTSPSPTGPVNPLSGPKPVLKAVQTVTLPGKPPVTVPCLWMSLRTAAAQSMAGIEAIKKVDPLGWIEGSEALARVLVSDTALETNTETGNLDPYGRTVFTDCEAILFAGHRYRVLAVRPASAAFRVPDTYIVWLSGAAKQ